MEQLIQLQKDFHKDMAQLHNMYVDRINILNMENDIKNTPDELVNVEQMQSVIENIENNTEQEQIWERMRNARSVAETPALINSTGGTAECIPIKQDNLLIETCLSEYIKENPILEPPEEETNKLKPPIINSLYKITPKQRKDVLMEIYNNASENMNELSKYDDDIKNNLDDEINNESNRLLQVYLDTH